MRPDVVWFGEQLDPRLVEQAGEAAQGCDVLLAIGTSAVVYPAAALPGIAQDAGAMVIEINTEDTPLTAAADIVLRGPAGQVLTRLESML
jgi:NAD-dependent deacetylase